MDRRWNPRAAGRAGGLLLPARDRRRPERRRPSRAWSRACCSSHGAMASGRHEHTMPGPKADRLALLRATNAQLSPIMASTSTARERYHHIMSRAWSDEWRARDEDGLLHQRGRDRAGRSAARATSRARRCSSPMATIGTRPPWPTRPRSVPTLRWPMRPRARSAADWIMMLLVNAELERARDPADASAPAAMSTPMHFATGWPARTRCAVRSRSRRRSSARSSSSARSPMSRSLASCCPMATGTCWSAIPDGLDDRLRRERMSRRGSCTGPRRAARGGPR